jgi:hypothetical protein
MNARPAFFSNLLIEGLLASAPSAIRPLNSMNARPPTAMERFIRKPIPALPIASQCLAAHPNSPDHPSRTSPVQLHDDPLATLTGREREGWRLANTDEDHRRVLAGLTYRGAA